MNKIAFLFPGQGSQALNMLKPLEDISATIIKNYCDRASSVVGFDMYELCTTDLHGKLQQTEFTQPALLVVGYISFLLYKERYGIDNIAYFAGHSLGEYTALLASEMLTFEDAVRLVSLRGKLMQSAVPLGTGSMFAILGMELSILNSICEEVMEQTSKIVASANINSPQQIVISGEKLACEMVAKLALEKGAKRALELPVSVPSHCMLMHSASMQLKESFAKIKWQEPSIPVIQNYNSKVNFGVDKILDALAKQMYSPVLWSQSLDFMRSQGINDFIEAAPGKVLTGLVKRMDAQVNCSSVEQVFS